MHLGILADETSWYFRDIARAAGDAGHECARLEFAQLTGGVIGQNALFSSPSGDGGLFDCDCVIVRSMPLGSLEQVVFRMDVLARFEAAGTPVINPPKSLECAIDKYLTTSRLAAAGLPVPETIVCQTADQAIIACEKLGGDVVVKPLFGAEGRGIVRVCDHDTAWRVCSTLERIGAVLYLQRFIDHGGSDVRILVLGDRVLGGMRRVATTGFRTNVSQQGHAERHVPTDREADLALRAVAATGAKFAGVDLLYDRDGCCYVIEVNGVPGWKAFARVNQMDVAAVFVGWLNTL
ncbi:MAG TPA: RimK family alpha-L-glutamate ligase [Planctomycetaceae bacterium]|nr:RimK family alpha-L-glutamate ligase [Planctomycetaceae bacterium]